MGPKTRAATPRQRRRKTHLPTTPDPSSPSPYSFPQTPSPNKHNYTLPEDDHIELSYEPSVRIEEETHQIIDKGKGKEKAAMNSREGSSTVGDSTLAEQELASATEELKALLPSRPIHEPVTKKRCARRNGGWQKVGGRRAARYCELTQHKTGLGWREGLRPAVLTRVLEPMMEAAAKK